MIHDVITSLIAQIIVGIVLALFDDRLDHRHDNEK
ncbi:type I toxin-antitoxin system Fst family toxin [Lactobacillus agrestimuris]|nr:type I toxin-antitoxin system Fst family toxin [Lactobacillus agrestimuris]